MTSRLTLVLCLALSCMAYAQPAAGPQPSSTITTNSTLVVVPALVRQSSGELVYNLKAGDFVLTDDGMPQALHLEEDTGGEPLAPPVVVEADAATRAAGWHPYRAGKAPDRFKGIPAMIEAIVGNVHHEVAVVGFDTHPELELDLTPDFDQVGDTIQQLDQGNDGDHGAGILDSLIFAVNLLQRAPAGFRKAILLVSETNDRGSTHTVEQAVRAISENNVAVYSVAFSTPFHAASEYGSNQLPTKALPIYERQQRKKAEAAAGPPRSINTPEQVAACILQNVMFGVTLENVNPAPPGGCMTGDPRRVQTTPMTVLDHLNQAYDCFGQLLPPLALSKLALIAATDSMKRNVPETVAKMTGGEYMPFSDARSLEHDLETLANHVPNRYILSFQPQSPHPGMHVLELRLKDYPQLKVNARTSYWVDESPTAPAVRTCTDASPH